MQKATPENLSLPDVDCLICFPVLSKGVASIRITNAVIVWDHKLWLPVSEIQPPKGIIYEALKIPELCDFEIIAETSHQYELPDLTKTNNWITHRRLGI